MIIAFIHQKGGTGKSTLSVATAIWLARRKRAVVLLDVDSQGTSSAWGRMYADKYQVKVIAQHARLLENDVKQIYPEYDDIILDLPPAVTPQTEKAIEVSDMLIIPMRPGNSDLWAIDRLIGLILSSDRKPPPPFKVIFTQCSQKKALSYAPKLSSRRISIFETVIEYSSDWQELFEGEDLSDEIDSVISQMMSELPVDSGLNIN